MNWSIIVSSLLIKGKKWLLLSRWKNLTQAHRDRQPHSARNASTRSLA